MIGCWLLDGTDPDVMYDQYKIYSISCCLGTNKCLLFLDSPTFNISRHVRLLQLPIALAAFLKVQW